MDKPIFKSTPTFLTPFILTILVMFPFTYFPIIYHKILVLVYIFVFFTFQYFLLKRVIFYNGKIIITQILKRKKDEILFENLEKIVVQKSKNIITVTIIAKTDLKQQVFPQKLTNYIKGGFEMYSNSNLKSLLEQLNTRGVKIEFSNKWFEESIKLGKN